MKNLDKLTINEDFAIAISDGIDNITKQIIDFKNPEYLNGSSVDDDKVMIYIKDITKQYIKKLNIGTRIWDSIKQYFGLKSIQAINTEIQNATNWADMKKAIEKINPNTELPPVSHYNTLANSISAFSNLRSERMNTGAPKNKESHSLANNKFITSPTEKKAITGHQFKR